MKKHLSPFFVIAFALVGLLMSGCESIPPYLGTSSHKPRHRGSDQVTVLNTCPPGHVVRVKRQHALIGGGVFTEVLTHDIPVNESAVFTPRAGNLQGELVTFIIEVDKATGSELERVKVMASTLQIALAYKPLVAVWRVTPSYVSTENQYGQIYGFDGVPR